MTDEFLHYDATDIQVQSSTSLTCVTPANFSGTVDVIVINTNGEGILHNGFTFVDEPVVDSISPDYGHILGNYKVTISGANFSTDEDTTVTFGGVNADGVSIVDSETLTCTIPAHAEGTVTVAVTNRYGTGEKPEARF